jgi:hypothetical protein
MKVLTDHLSFIRDVIDDHLQRIDREDNHDFPPNERRNNMTPAEGANFENVYHVHNPRLSLCNDSRNVSGGVDEMQYERVGKLIQTLFTPFRRS